MKGVLLTGGTGFIGGHLREALRTESVVLLGRTKPDLSSNERWIFMDLAQEVLSEMLVGGDVICHLAYSMSIGRQNLEYNRRLLDAVNLSSNIRQVVLMSTTSVYGDISTPVVDEKSPCEPAGEYAGTKLACEMLWREGLRDGCALTVLRPSEVIGAGGKGLLPIIQDALLRPVVGTIKRSVLYHRSMHYVAVGNVVASVLFSLRCQKTSEREIFVVADDHYPENAGYAAMQDAIRTSSGRRPFYGLAAPQWVLTLLGRFMGRPKLGSRWTFSSRKIHDAGFQDAVVLYDEVGRTVKSFEQQYL